MALDKQGLLLIFSKIGYVPSVTDWQNLINLIPDGTDEDIANNVASLLVQNPSFAAQLQPKTADNLNNPNSTTLPTTLAVANRILDIINDYNAKIATVSEQASTAIEDEAVPTTVPVDTTNKFVKYSIATAGTYANFPDASSTAIVVSSDDLNEGIVELWGKNNVWSKNIIPMPMATLALKSDVATKIDETELQVQKSVNLASLSYLQVDAALVSTGIIGHYAGSKAIADLPLTDATVFTLGGFLAAANKYFAIVDSSGDVVDGTVHLLSALPYTFNKPTGGVAVRFTVKNETETDDSNFANTLMLNEGDTLLSYQTPNDYLLGIGNRNNATKIILAGSSAPDPLTDENVMNFRTFKNKGVLATDMTITPSLNLALDAYKVEGLGVDGTGEKFLTAGWRSYRIPLTGFNVGDAITFGNFNITTGGYSAFYDNTDTPTAGNTGLVLFNGSFTNLNLPKTVSKPANAAFLYITVKRPADADSNSINLVICKGTTLIDYVNPNGTLSKIKGYDIGGGNSNVKKFSDLQDVPAYAGNGGKMLAINASEDGVEVAKAAKENTDVIFNTVACAGLSIADLPTGNGVEPPGLDVGDVWIDNTSSNLKVKLI